MEPNARAPIIYLIRHAEKPDQHNAGVRLDGAPDESSLTVRGWQRAGALIAAFNPTPGHLFASHSSSNRPAQTLVPIAEKLGVTTNLQFGKGDEQRLVQRAAGCRGVVLICWQHDYMAAVANAILGDRRTAPQEWPEDRFDVTWIFERDGEGYKFSQRPQMLLSGDSPDLIAL